MIKFQGLIEFDLHSFFIRMLFFLPRLNILFFSADFRLKIFLYYCYIIAYGISLLEFN